MFKFIPFILILYSDSAVYAKVNFPNILSFGSSLNSKINVEDHSIFDVLNTSIFVEIHGTTDAIAGRISTSDQEVQDTLDKLNVQNYLGVKDEVIASADRAESNYLVWGSKETGGFIPNEVYETLGVAKPPQQINHYITLNDLCALKDAFIGIYNKKLACWGSSTTCAGASNINGIDATNVSKVHCHANAVAAVVILTKAHSQYGGFVSVMGDVENGGKFPDDGDFPTLVRSFSASSIIKAVGTPKALAVLTEGGHIYSWGHASYVIPSALPSQFATDMIANEIGFSAVTVSSQVYAWGTIDQNSVPDRVKPGGARTVKTLYGRNECFAAILDDNSVSTWGLGDHEFCTENGAILTDTYVAYSDIKDRLTNVQNLIMNNEAILAIDSNGQLIPWGKISSGGLVTSDVQSYQPIIETIVATTAAFAYIAKDGRLVVWGDQGYAGYVDPYYVVMGSKKLAAIDTTMAAITSDNDFIIWGSDVSAYYSHSNAASDEFAIANPLIGIYVTKHGIVTVGKKACDSSDWSEWSKCSVKCGTGTRSRSRSASNGNDGAMCSNASIEFESCKGTECGDDPSQASGLKIGQMVVVGGAGVGLFGLFSYCCTNVCRRQAVQETL